MSLLKRYLALSKLQVVSRKVVRGTKEKTDAFAPGSQERFGESLRLQSGRQHSNLRYLAPSKSSAAQIRRNTKGLSLLDTELLPEC